MFVLFIGRFVTGHFSEMKFLAPGLLLLGLTIGSLIFSSYKLSLYYGIRAGFSVVQTQTKVARLQVPRTPQYQSALPRHSAFLRTFHDCPGQGMGRLRPVPA